MYVIKWAKKFHQIIYDMTQPTSLKEKFKKNIMHNLEDNESKVQW